MGFLTIKKIKDILPKVAKVADNVFLAGAVQNITEDTDKNPKGSVDWVKLIKTLFTYTIPALVLLAIISGKLTMEDAEKFLKLVK
jgi:hypothetical protein